MEPLLTRTVTARFKVARNLYAALLYVWGGGKHEGNNCPMRYICNGPRADPTCQLRTRVANHSIGQREELPGQIHLVYTKLDREHDGGGNQHSLHVGERGDGGEMDRLHIGVVRKDQVWEVL